MTAGPSVNPDFGGWISVTGISVQITVTEIRDYGDSAFNSHVPVDVVTVPQVSFAAGRHSRYARPYGSEPSTVKAWAKAERDKEKCTVTVTKAVLKFGNALAQCNCRQ